jgi:cobalamin biosynthesis protein CobD/CbiB
MFLSSFCPPALIYLIFMLIHVIVEIFNGSQKGAMLQLIIGLLMTLLLQLLCLKNMTIISWIIVFIPFILYTYMMFLLYQVFGLNPEDKERKYLVK